MVKRCSISHFSQRMGEMGHPPGSMSETSGGYKVRGVWKNFPQSDLAQEHEERKCNGVSDFEKGQERKGFCNKEW